MESIGMCDCDKFNLPWSEFVKSNEYIKYTQFLLPLQRKPSLKKILGRRQENAEVRNIYPLLLYIHESYLENDMRTYIVAIVHTQKQETS